MQPVDQKKFNEMVANCEKILTEMNKRITALEQKAERKPRQKKPEESVEC